MGGGVTGTLCASEFACNAGPPFEPHLAVQSGMSDPIQDRLRGVLIGLAVGDALGAAVEFSAPGTFAPVTGFRGGGPHGLSPGEWTDDTSMALALAESLASGWDLNDQ